tara:strand:- start:19127 stop:19645 length:519 start_codon:yes stop_codon:yes gene_type:complete
MNPSTHVEQFKIWAPVADEQGVTLNTKDLQMMSLMLFLEKLGYEMKGKFDSQDWSVTTIEQVAGYIFFPYNLSFDRAVRLHNNEDHWQGLPDSSRVSLFTEDGFKSAESLKVEAIGAKLVKKIKVQKKKGGGIKVNNHMVELIDWIGKSVNDGQYFRLYNHNSNVYYRSIPI